jgi:hypothetical protein
MVCYVNCGCTTCDHAQPRPLPRHNRSYRQKKSKFSVHDVLEVRITPADQREEIPRCMRCKGHLTTLCTLQSVSAWTPILSVHTQLALFDTVRGNAAQNTAQNACADSPVRNGASSSCRQKIPEPRALHRLTDCPCMCPASRGRIPAWNAIALMFCRNEEVWDTL